ncbi:MAG: 50S ribosomal protein L12, partial [Candidatus Hermodarchaeota archaeon]|nr:50S ribosomal protein L12 [Candidatus Hermodarchaeota archaeon]
MEYIYSAMLLHKAGKKISAASLTKILDAAGVTPDEGRIKALVATLKDIDIEEAIKAVPVAAAPAAAPAAADAPAEKKPEEKK